MIWRVQDALGRGPFKPGYTRQWVDDIECSGPAVDMRLIKVCMAYAQLPGSWPFGYGCYGLAALCRWFTINEMRRLMKDGYRVVQVSDCRVLAENSNEVLFVRPTPLALGVLAVSLNEVYSCY